MSTHRANSEAGRPITIDQWIALNDEMVALVRAGLPLDRGLALVGREITDGTGEIAVRIGEALGSGRSLEQAVADEGNGLPDLYRAVIAAGTRSGRLGLALESTASFARSVAETRRAIGAAMFYPLLVAATAFGMFTYFVFLVLPKFVSTAETFNLPSSTVVRTLRSLSEYAPLWLPIFPLLIAALGILWFWSNRASSLRPSRLWGVFRIVPGFGAMLENAWAANLADMLSLLVEHGVPLDAALRLAADATGDPSTRRAAMELADAVERGEAVTTGFNEKPGPFPPLLRWVLATGSLQPDLSGALRHAARTYRARAAGLAESMTTFLPSVMILCLGTTAALIYALAVFGPMAALWYELADPANHY